MDHDFKEIFGQHMFMKLAFSSSTFSSSSSAVALVLGGTYLVENKITNVNNERNKGKGFLYKDIYPFSLGARLFET